MKDLKELFVDLGFFDVVTYIQSGNVIFAGGDDDDSEVTVLIEQGIESAFGFEVPVLIRSHRQLAKVASESPFGTELPAAEGTKYLVAFLDSTPSTERSELLEPLATNGERFALRGTHLYLHYPNGSARTKLSNTAMEKRLQVAATVRNWKSLIKLRDLSASN